MKISKKSRLLLSRSSIMKRVGRENTKPELKVRAKLHVLGLRFRLHRRDLPGTPDIVLTKHRTVIFVHGCFWHRHLGCRYATTPKTRQEYWIPKFEANITRDVRKRPNYESWAGEYWLSGSVKPGTCLYWKHGLGANSTFCLKRLVLSDMIH